MGMKPSTLCGVEGLTVVIADCAAGAVFVICGGFLLGPGG
jgi:hypothetical protein